MRLGVGGVEGNGPGWIGFHAFVEDEMTLSCFPMLFISRVVHEPVINKVRERKDGGTKNLPGSCVVSHTNNSLSVHLLDPYEWEMVLPVLNRKRVPLLPFAHDVTLTSVEWYERLSPGRPQTSECGTSM